MTELKVGDLVRATAHLREPEGEVGLVLVIEKETGSENGDGVGDAAKVCWNNGGRDWNWVYNLKKVRND